MPKKNEMVLVSKKDLVKLLDYNQEPEEKHYEEFRQEIANPRNHAWHVIKRLAKQAGHKFT